MDRSVSTSTRERPNLTISTTLWCPTDGYVMRALRAGDIVVDPRTGAITNRAGERMERPDKRDGSGWVTVQRLPRRVSAPAGRIVWLAMHGEIPKKHVVKHENGRKWDNRPTNLYLSRARGFVTYPEAAR
jgi:hypothetical protein